jgi:hypothetical protein
MADPTVLVINCETGETEHRPMKAGEQKAHAKAQKETPDPVTPQTLQERLEGLPDDQVVTVAQLRDLLT